MHYPRSKTLSACLSLGFLSAIAATTVGCASTDSSSTSPGSTSPGSTTAKDPETVQPSGKNTIPIADSVKHCFRNEYSSGDITDIEELNITIADAQATGVYNWLPALKDKRLGEFEGVLTNDTVDAIYTYEQEGVSESVPISILINEDSATVEGGEPALGLDATLERSEC